MSAVSILRFTSSYNTLCCFIKNEFHADPTGALTSQKQTILARHYRVQVIGSPGFTHSTFINAVTTHSWCTWKGAPPRSNAVVFYGINGHTNIARTTRQTAQRHQIVLTNYASQLQSQASLLRVGSAPIHSTAEPRSSQWHAPWVFPLPPAHHAKLSFYWRNVTYSPQATPESPSGDVSLPSGNPHWGTWNEIVELSTPSVSTTSSKLGTGIN